MTPMPVPRPATLPAVLVVEDEVLIRMEAMAMIEDAGFRVHGARSADAALAVLMADADAGAGNAADIGIVFTDVDMPGSMNGLALAAHVHRNWPRIGIVIASGVMDITDNDIPDGARFFPKPYPTTQIVACLTEMAERMTRPEGG